MEVKIKKIIKKMFLRMGYNITRIENPLLDIPDFKFYTPLFSPWLGYGGFKHFYDKARPHTLLSSDRCYVLYILALQALSLRGDVWECGVYKGGTALLLAELIVSTRGARAQLHLFDTFKGMPETNKEKDLHQAGGFSDTSLSAVRKLVGQERIVHFHEGFIPDTFSGFENANIAFAHIDVDVYQSLKDCCEFIMPRLIKGGFVVIDDYGFPSCPGARMAVDEFFKNRAEKPLVLATGQAVVFKSF